VVGVGGAVTRADADGDAYLVVHGIPTPPIHLDPLPAYIRTSRDGDGDVNFRLLASDGNSNSPLCYVVLIMHHP
jgi:hypothetical protein